MLGLSKLKRLFKSIGDKFNGGVDSSLDNTENVKLEDLFKDEKTADKQKRNKDVGDNISDIKKQFDKMDIMTTSAVAIMLCETKERAMSRHIRQLEKANLQAMLLNFCKDTYFATDIRQIEKLFTGKYYRNKTKIYLKKLDGFVKSGIRVSLPKDVPASRIRNQKNIFINKACSTIRTFESVKYTPALSGNEEWSRSMRNYKLDHLNDCYKDALIYMVDILLTCTCISKMLFIERMIDKMDENAEFHQMIKNMSNSFSDHNTIISKSRPLYKQYYQSELGYISGDDLLYGFAITIMVNKMKNNSPITNNSANSIFSESDDVAGFRERMLQWLDNLAGEEGVGDVGMLILYCIKTRISDNYGFLITALSELTAWEEYYHKRVAFNEKEMERKRYLSGDFS